MSTTKKRPTSKDPSIRSANREHTTHEPSPDAVLRFDRRSLEIEMIRVRSALRAGDEPNRCGGHSGGP